MQYYIIRLVLYDLLPAALKLDLVLSVPSQESSGKAQVLQALRNYSILPMFPIMLHENHYYLRQILKTRQILETICSLIALIYIFVASSDTVEVLDLPVTFAL